ncbi:MAG TPA: hypothetical protein VM537_02900 [Anaerolineae bacterium]|nr:hypothetical protein [Anaerolineae bacterium]
MMIIHNLSVAPLEMVADLARELTLAVQEIDELTQRVGKMEECAHAHALFFEEIKRDPVGSLRLDYYVLKQSHDEHAV